MGRRLVWISLWCGFWCLGGCGPSKQNPQTPQQPVSCVSTTCAAQGKNCGTMPDGCGGTLNCGTCSAGLVCGGGGVVNVCGTQAQPGSTRWTVIGSGTSDYTALSADSQGNVVGVTAGTDATGLENIRVAMHNRKGQRVWSRPDFIPAPDNSSLKGVSVSQGNGEICVWGDYHDPDGPPGTLIYRLAPDGTNPTELAFEQSSYVLFFTGCVESPSGDVFYGFASSSHGTRDNVIYRDGSKWTLEGAYNGLNPNPLLVLGQPIATDPDGNWIAIGSTVDQTSVQGQTVGRAGERSWVVLKADHSGKLIWTRTLSAQSYSIQAVGTSATGTIVLLGQFSGTLNFGSDTLTSPTGNESEVLMTLKADGSPQWAKQLPLVVVESPQPQMAVDPRGQVAILGTEGCGFTLLKYNLADDSLWQRTFTPDGCQGSVAAQGVTIASGDVVVSGSFQGSIDFGNGPVHSDGQEAFLLDIAP